MDGRCQPPIQPTSWLWTRRLLILLLLVAVLWAGAPAWAANAEDASGTRYGQRGSPHTTGPIITDTAIPEALGTATLFIPWFLSFTGGNFSPGWRRVSAGGNFRSLSVYPQLYYGILPHTSIYVVVPYLHNWAWEVNQPAPTGQRGANFGGLGDVSLTVKHLLIDEQPNFPAIAGIFSATFPSGHHLHLNPGNLGTDQLGSGAYAFTPGLNFQKYVPPVMLYANLWYTMYTAASVAGKRLYYPDRVTVNLALEWPLIRDRWVFLWELVSYYDAGRLCGHVANTAPQAFVSTQVGLEFLATHDFSLVPGILVDLLGKNTSYNFTPNLTVFYYF
jgi:hypothetical protein